MTSRTAPALSSSVCIFTFALGLAGACCAIHETLPFPDVPMVRPKLEYLAAHGGEFDTLFIGSSRIYYQIIPALFDRFASERGVPTKSFNAGIAGMRPPEDSFLLDTIFQHPAPRLRWVFVELTGLRSNVGDDKRNTLRAVYWHDWARMKLLLTRALDVNDNGKRHRWMERLEMRVEPFGDFLDHVELFIQNQTSLGRAAPLIARFLNPDDTPLEQPDFLSLGADSAGWVPSGYPEIMSPTEAAKYDRALLELRRDGHERDPGDPASLQALKAMLARIESRGARPILVIPPTTGRRNFHPDSDEIGTTPVLDFSDPEKFPELFEPQHRLDKVHLNTAGAKIFSRTLVEAWLQATAR